MWSASDHVLATLTHAAIGFGFFGIGFLLSLAISGVIWLASRRSPHVAVHAEQAGAYQLFVFVVNVVVIVGWLVGSVALFGQVVLFPPADHTDLERTITPIVTVLWLLAVPAFGLWYVGTILFGLFGAVRVATGRAFWYPVFGRWARRKHGFQR